MPNERTAESLHPEVRYLRGLAERFESPLDANALRNVASRFELIVADADRSRRELAAERKGHIEWVVAHQKDTDAAWRQVNAAERERDAAQQAALHAQEHCLAAQGRAHDLAADVERLERELAEAHRDRELTLMNLKLALDGVPVEHRSNIVIENKPAVLQSVMLTMAHLSSLAAYAESCAGLLRETLPYHGFLPMTPESCASVEALKQRVREALKESEGRD